MKYFAYVRKSTEGEERQALSIQSQIDKAKEIFGNLNIVEILEEKHSAFKPNNRPVFAEMIKRIQRGEARGIVAWHPDRLSRNEIDASTITYLVRTSVIHDLKFASYTFDNSPEGIMMLQMALSQSQYFSSKLGKDVKRGMEQKFNMGWQPNICPNGYINVSWTKTTIATIEPDKVRFKQLRRAFDLMLTGNYSVSEILDKLNNEWGFKPKTGKDYLSLSSLYRIFTSLFYTGIIQFAKKQKIGKHKPMISLEEYDRIQLLLGRKGKPRSRKNNFAFTGLIRCDECGCLVSADLKRKLIKSTGKFNEYTYYRCTHKKPGILCKEPAVEVKELEKQIDRELAKYEFNPRFKKLLFEILEDEKRNNPNNNQNVIAGLNLKMEKLELEKVNLTKMSCKGLINDDEYLAQKNDYEKDILSLGSRIKKVKCEKNNDDGLIKEINFATSARVNFSKGSKKDRREVLSRLGTNRTLKGRKLHILAHKWLIPIKKDLKRLEAKFATIEPVKGSLVERKNPVYAELIPEMCTR